MQNRVKTLAQKTSKFVSKVVQIQKEAESVIETKKRVRKDKLTRKTRQLKKFVHEVKRQAGNMVQRLVGRQSRQLKEFKVLSSKKLRAQEIRQLKP